MDGSTAQAGIGSGGPPRQGRDTRTGARDVRRLETLFKRDADVFILASCKPRVPWYAKAIAIAVVAYAASPIDLIPDFIPVIGYLDDLISVPLGIALVIKLIPPR